MVNLSGWSHIYGQEIKFNDEISYKDTLRYGMSKKEYHEYMNLIKSNKESTLTNKNQIKLNKKAGKYQFSTKRYTILIERRVG